MQNAINNLKGLIRSEDVGNDYLRLFAGQNILKSVFNIQNQVIYGRRGTGKTHLLKALEELCYETMHEERILPVYLDLRKVSPLNPNNPDYIQKNAEIYFYNIINSIVESVYNHSDLIINPLLQLEGYTVRDIKNNLNSEMNKLGVILKGDKIQKHGEFSINVENIASVDVEGGFKNFWFKGNRQKKTSETIKGYSYINFGLISNVMDEIIRVLKLNNILVLLDEWSEIELNIQPYLAELLKSAFISSKVKIKVAAIKYRTKLLDEVNSKNVGLEDGGDIFGEDLDNKYVYEINKTNTKAYFSELLFKHLVRLNKNLNDYSDNENNLPNESFMNDIFTQPALKELLIGSAGISRDFLNIFINSYAEFLNETSQKITVNQIRRATQTWYQLDKQYRIDNAKAAKKLLDKIVNYVIRDKKVTHFLVPQSCFDNEYLQKLVDLRAIHIRRRGYSHQDIKGVVYDVYSVDYGCYTNNNVLPSQLNNRGLDEIAVIEDLREIRRIAVDDNFFSEHRLEIGEGIKCNNCKKIINTTHPAFIAQNLCNNCWLPHNVQ